MDEHDQATEQEPSHDLGDQARRDFLTSCGKFALTVPPIITVLLSTSLASPAIAKSGGGGGGGGRGHGGGRGGGGGRGHGGGRGGGKGHKN